MQAISRLAFQVDKHGGRRSLEPFYIWNTFRIETMGSQEDSPFMALPAEIRLSIYERIFQGNSSTYKSDLSILATCRQVHGEAIVKALRMTCFHLSHISGLEFESRLRRLGPSQQHLRHIKVRMPIQQLNASSATNPFILTQLPLDTLHIDFGEIEDTDHWLQKIRVCQRLISAMLYQIPPGNTGSAAVSLHQSLVSRCKRIIADTLLQPWATKKHLFHLLRTMKTKRILLECSKDGTDIFWSAFTHFGLVDACCSLYRASASGKEHYVMFGDDGDKNFVEMGQWPPQSQI